MLYYIVFYYLYIYIYIIARLLSLCQEKLKDYMGMMVYHIYIYVVMIDSTTIPPVSLVDMFRY